MTQAPAPITSVILRTSGDPALAAGNLRAALHALDPDMAVGTIRALSATIDAQLSRERLMASLATCFGLLALVLTCVGVYGVISYAVERRTREIGIRLALGGTRAQVTGALMREVATLVGASVALGGTGAVLMTRAMRTMLFGFGPNDYGLLLVVGLVLAAVAATAGLVPARRAAGLDPMAALRE
jgi:putative ABC transport system permease protein